MQLLIYLIVSINIIIVSSFTNINKLIKLSSSTLNKMKEDDIYDLVLEYLTSKGK